MTCRITIGIPTFRRNDDLRELLPLLMAQKAELERTGDYDVTVAVVDNDPDGGAAGVVADLAATFAPADRLAVRYVHEPRPGLAAVRNAALVAAADDRLLAFMDDDGRPDDGWLVALVHTWERSGAAAVAGRLVERYETDPPPCIASGVFFRRFSLATMTPVTVAPTGNLLLDLDEVRRLGLTFDERFGATGGEDTMFTTQLTRGGGRIVWCDESRVIDLVPASRMTREWVLARARSQGALSARVADTLARGPVERVTVRLRFAVHGATRLAGGGARAAYGRSRGDVRAHARGLRTAHRGVGMLLGSAGGRATGGG